MDHVNVDIDQAFLASRVLGNKAVALREELVTLDRIWDDLSARWSGSASSAYSTAWTQWRSNANTLMDTLSELAQKIGYAATVYSERDDSREFAFDRQLLSITSDALPRRARPAAAVPGRVADVRTSS